MDKNHEKLNRKLNYKWQVIEGIVNTSQDFIKVTYDDYSVPYTLLGLSRYRTVIVQYFCGERPWQKMVQKALTKIKEEIGYYLLEKGERNPWEYLIKFSSKPEDVNRPIRWQWFPGGNPNLPDKPKDHQWHEYEITAEKEEVRHQSALVQFKKGVAHLDLNELEEAYTAFSRSIEIEADDTDWYVYRGIALRRMEKMNLALQDFSAAIELDPDNDFAYCSRGYCYYMMGIYEEALADCGKAIELAPNDQSYYRNRGMVYMEEGDLEKALADYNKAIELAPRETASYESRADVFLKMGKLDMAKESLEEILKIDPHDIHVFATHAQIKLSNNQNNQTTNQI